LLQTGNQITTQIHHLNTVFHVKLVIELPLDFPSAELCIFVEQIKTSHAYYLRIMKISPYGSPPLVFVG